jgi:hypothetical protein
MNYKGWCGTGECRSRDSACGVHDCTIGAPHTEICGDWKDRDCDGIPGNCCKNTGYQPVPWQVNSFGDYPHDTTAAGSNYANRIDSRRGLVVPDRVSSSQFLMDLIDFEASDRLTVGGQTLNGRNTCYPTECLLPPFPRGWGGTATPFNFFTDAPASGSTTANGWSMDFQQVQCLDGSPQVTWVVAEGDHVDGILTGPNDTVSFSVFVPAGQRARAYLSFPSTVRTVPPGPAFAPFVARFAGIDLSSRPTGFAAGVRRASAIGQCGTANLRCEPSPLQAQQQRGFGAVTMPTMMNWVGEVADIPIRPSSTTWFFMVKGYQGAGPFSFIVNRTVNLDTLDVVTEIPQSGSLVALAVRETERAMQTILEVSDGQSSITDNPTFTNGVWCPVCHALAFGGSDDYCEWNWAGLAWQCHGDCNTATTYAGGLPFSWIHVPVTMWTRTGGSNGCNVVGEQMVGQVIAHEWGHEAMGYKDEYVGGSSQNPICTGPINLHSCDGHSLMSTRSDIGEDNKVEWCTSANHATDKDPDVSVASSASNWDVAADRLNRCHNPVPSDPVRVPPTGTPLPTRFGNFMGAEQAGFLRWTYR